VDIPGWQLEEELGVGGNGTVWRACREDGSGPFALKVIKSSNIATEPYRRFVQEIEVLRRLGDFAGVLPLIDAHLPEQASKADRPWLAMPVATPMAASLNEQSLETAVMAMQAVADTLARLQADHDIGHRDIKPGNLYELNGRWLVGDFGLAHAPDLSDLTQSGRPLGPRHFAAYEMLVNPAGADPHPADVYSLGKTLWVLATGGRYPPEGPQSTRVRGFRIADFRSDPRSLALDRLLERMTRMHPPDRPSKREVADELERWLALPLPSNVEFEAELMTRLRAGLADELAQRDENERLLEGARGFIRRFQERFRPINEFLLSIRSDAEIDVETDEAAWNLLEIHEYGRRSLHRHVRMSRIFSGDINVFPLEMKVARSIELLDDGRIHINSFVIVALAGVFRPGHHWQSDGHSALVESIETDQMLDTSITELGEQVRIGLEQFAQRIGAPDS